MRNDPLQQRFQIHRGFRKTSNTGASKICVASHGRGLRLFLILIIILPAGCALDPPGALPCPDSTFLLYTEAPQKKAQALSQEAATFLKDLGGYLNLQAPPGALLRIYHYRWRFDLWRYLNEAVPLFRWRPGVCFETDEAYHIAISGKSERAKFKKILRHELTHYLLAFHYSYIPPWFDEGMAQLMACGPPFPHLDKSMAKTIKKTMRRTKLKACTRTIQIPRGKRLSRSQYHIACALTHYLLNQSTDRDVARPLKYLEIIHKHSEPQQAFSSFWNISIDEACESIINTY